jgi:hypothetical protein
MAVAAGNYGAILTNGVGQAPPAAPDFVEFLTEGWFAGLDVSTFPPVEVEVLYPIVPQAESGSVIFQRDDRGFAAVKKSAAAWRREYIQLAVRVRHSNFPTLWAWLTANRARLVSVNLPGVQPFIRAAEENSAFLLDFSAPDPVFPFVYQINITFLRVSL